VYRTWVAIGVAGLLSGVAVVSLFVGFGSPAFLGVAAVGATGGYLAYRYARERMLASVYAGVETDPAGSVTDSGTGGSAPDGSGFDGSGSGGSVRDPSTVEGSDGEASAGDRRRATQATDGGETSADYDDWTWADGDPDDPFWSDDPDDWEDPWEWEATDPEEAGANGWRRQGTTHGPGAGRRSSWTGRTDGRSDGRSDADGEGARPTLAEAYEILGLEPGADLGAVREAYRERAKETHPDCGGNRETFRRVREAYERLRERLDGEDR